MPAPVTQPPANGLENPWDVRKTISGLQLDAAQLQPLLAQIDPQQWVNAKGAPTTYIVQWQSAQQQLRDLLTISRLFAQKPDSLSQGLDLYFRLESLETAERSLGEGVQHYDSPANAGKLNSLIAHNFDSRQHLRDYLRDLALSTEQNFKIADAEAQRCRTAISKEAIAPPGRRAKKN